MNKNSKSTRLLNKMYSFIGRLVVFGGTCLGVFFAVSNVISITEPYVYAVASFCVNNIRWLMMTVAVVVISIWGIVYAWELYQHKKVLKISESDDSTEEVVELDSDDSVPEMTLIHT